MLIFQDVMVEDHYPFPKLGYVSFPEGLVKYSPRLVVLRLMTRLLQWFASVLKNTTSKEE